MDNAHGRWSHIIRWKPRKSVSQPPFKGSEVPPIVTTSGTAKRATLMGLKVFKDAIDGISFLAPLKGSISALLTIVEAIEQKDGVVEDLRNLNRRARVLTEKILQPLVGKQDVEIPVALKERLETFSSGIQKVVDTAEPLTHQDSISAVINASHHSQTLSELNSTIDELLSHFTLDQQINNEILTHREKLTKHVQNLPRIPASYNSNQHESASKSSRRRTRAPGTAKGIMNKVDAWINSASDPQVLIVHGLAGVGKSTLAQTICESRDSPENTGTRLGASFFFIRNLYDKSENFFPTLAFQLAERDPSYIPHLGHYLASILSIDSKPTQTQFQEMIVKPLSNIPTSPASRSLIVIDALDECNMDDAQLILRLLTSATAELLPKVLVTCRLEAHLRAALGLRDNVFEGNFERFKLVDTFPLIDPHDIGMYIRSELQPDVISEEFPNCEWNIAESDLLALQSAAGNLFIMASTMVEFIKDDDVYNPTGQLKVLLQDLRREKLIETSPYTRLDLLYATILRSSITRSSEELLQRYRNVVGTIIFLQEPLSVPDLAALIGLTADYVGGTIRKLSSVINTNNAIRAPQLYHISFTDFLTDPRRCGNDTIGDNRFFVDTNERHAWIAERCLDIIIELDISEHEMRNNRNDIPSLENRIQSAISPALLYACRYWAGHLSLTTRREGALVDKLNQFAFDHLLMWIEVLSWADRLADARAALELVLAWTALQPQIPSLYDMFYDAQRFLHTFYITINDSPTNIYSSALPSAPSTSLIFQTYFKKFNFRSMMAVQILEGRPKQWPVALAVLGGHTKEVSGVFFSTDGKRLVSKSDDDTIRLWDGMTGEPIAELSGQRSSIDEIAFSSDGKRLTTLSLRHTVQLWDGVTGESIAELYDVGSVVPDLGFNLVTFSPDDRRLAFTINQPQNIVLLLDAATGRRIAEFIGDPRYTSSLEFSPDGKRLAFASAPNTIQLWDGVTGESIAQLECQDSADNITFSPDGKQLAASFYNLIRLWDAMTGKPIVVLKGHQRSPRFIVFSPNNERLASAPHDETDTIIRLWNSVTGQPIAELKYHQKHVTYIRFSQDGKRLMSRAIHESIHLWDGVTGEDIAELEDFSPFRSYTTFSPDGKRVATSSKSYAASLWDAVTGRLIAQFPRPRKVYEFTKVAFSPDSMRLAFASDDNTIHLWDCVTGEPIIELKGHRGWISDISFSHDSKRLASASHDHTVRLWDATAKVRIEEPGDAVTAIALSSDRKRIASLSKNSIQLWNGFTGEHIAKLQAPEGRIWCIAFSPDGGRLASAHSDSDSHFVLLWDSVTGQRVAELQGHRGVITYVAFSSDSKHLFSASRDDETIQLWDGVTGTHFSASPIHPLYLEDPSQFPFSPPILPFSSQGLAISKPNARGSYIFSLNEVSTQSNTPLFWIPAWMLVNKWWPLPSGGIFISGPHGQVYILAPNDS